MSENNNNLSIDEIIRRAQQIREEAERQLQAAEKRVDDKAKAAQQEVYVDERAVAERVAKAVDDAAADEDVKTFVPKKVKADDDVKVVQTDDKTKPVFPEPDDDVKVVPTDGKTKPVFPEPDDDVKVVPTDDKTKPVFPEPDDDVKVVPTDDKTKPVVTGKASEKTQIVTGSKEKKAHKDTPPDEKTKTVFVSRNSDAPDPDNDLEQVPTLIAKDKLYDGFTQEDNAFEAETGIQMTFEGFDDAIEDVPKIDEDEAERDLYRRRVEKVDKFRLFGPEDTDAALSNETALADDYVNHSDKESFLDRLYAGKQKTQHRLIATAVLFVPLLLLAVGKNSASLPNFLADPTAYFICALLLFLGVIVANSNSLRHGLSLKKGLNFDTPLTVVTLLTALHTAVCIFDSGLFIDNGVLLASACTFSLFLSQLGKQRMMARLCDNFAFLTDGADKYTVENIANAVDAGIISRGLLDEEAPRLKYSVKTDFPTNFLEISCKREPADKIATRLFAATLVLSAALLVTVGLLDNFNTGVNVSLSALVISLPSTALFLTNALLCDISGQLSAYGSRVCGYEGAVMAEDSDAIVMEAADLFDKSSCDLYGFKTFGGAKIDDALIYIASVIVQTKSPLRHVFEEVIIGQSILPKVEGVQYEERLGTSAWVYKRKVLVGTRELLQHHGVNVPKKSYEEKYTVKGRKAVYLAVGGEIIAMFIVSYSADPDLKRELAKLEKTGKTVIVKSADPYINEESLAKLFDLPEGFIRVMNYSAARVYDKYSSPSVEKSPAYLAHSGNALSLISAMRGAGMLVSSRGLIAFLCTFGSMLGFAVVAALSLLEGYAQITPLSIILFQLIWLGFSAVVTKLKGSGV
ncbi:MAG: hypothetical protein IJ168_04645 [Eubacterium sp.]|nr:hypothetical protein [Eubacterium sp.]